MRRGTAAATAVIARADAGLAADLIASGEVTRDRRARLDRLREDALPLLADLGNGVLDPSDDAVRARCGSCAAELRRLMTRPSVGSELLDGLEPALRAAERRAVAVRVQIAGSFDTVAPAARDEVVAALSAVLAEIRAGPATITLTGGNETGSAFVTADDAVAAGGFAPPVPATWTEIIDDSGDGQVCVEVRWSPPAPVVEPRTV